jgi:hypothetical protein
MARVNRAEGRPTVFYLHPWEIDPAQPRLSAPLAARVRHYRNLHLTEGRLTRLMQRFTFGTMAELIASAPLSPPRTPLPVQP